MRNSQLIFLAVLLFTTLTAKAQLVVTINPFETICEGTSIQLIPTVSGGDGNYTYSWSGEFLDNAFIHNPTASPAVTTSYSVNVMDGTGQTGSTSVTVTVVMPDIVIQEEISAACFGMNNGSISLTVSPVEVDYQWSNGALGSEITGLSSGDYFVTIMDINGCSAEAFYTVPEVAGMPEIIAPTTSCAQELVAFSAESVIGATYSWQFSGNPTTSSLTETEVTASWEAAGLYTATLTVVLNDCEEVYIHQINITESVWADAGPDIVVCQGGSIEIGQEEGLSGPMGASYSWAPNLFLNNSTVAQPLASPPFDITYILTVTQNGCVRTDSAEVVINPDLNPVVDAGADLTACEDEAVTLGANPTAQASSDNPTDAILGTLWSDLNSSPNDFFSTESNPVITAGQSSSFQVVAYATSGCTDTATVEVTVLERPMIDISNTFITDADCNGALTGEIDLTVTGGTAPYTYTWTGPNGFASPSEDLTGLESGTYSVVLTDSEGCTDTADFLVSEPASLEITYQTTEVSCGASDGTIDVSVTGGTPPYTYTWNNGAITESIANLAAGSYSLTVTDANGCTFNQVFEINQAVEPFTLPDLYLDCNHNPVNSLNINNDYAAPQYSVEWQGPDGFTYDAIDLTNYDTPGVYTLTITNNDFPECPFNTSTNVYVVGGNIEVSIDDCNVYTLSANVLLPPNFSEEIDLLWTMPDGSTSEMMAITPALSGAYTLAISIPEYNCDLHYTQFIDLEQESCATIEGFVRYDVSENCIAENTELGIPDIIVSATNGGLTYNAITDESGYYRMNVLAGNYTITHSLLAPSWVACQESYTVDLSAVGTTETLDIPIQGAALCPDLSLSLTSTNLRRCFTSSYILTICNEGTQTAIMPEVAMVLDAFLNYSSASTPPDAINGQQLNWIFDEIAVGACKTIVVWVNVSCEATLGQTHCTEAIASTYPFCGEANNWSGASLELTGQCNDDEVVFNIQNLGQNDLAESINYIIIEDAIAMMEASGTIDDLPASETASFSFPANGSTYTFITDQVANHPYSLRLSGSIEGCGTNDEGGFSTGFVNQFGQQTSAPSSTIFCIENTGSYDPNDKAAIPAGYGDAHYIEPENKINYRIRFQNTGTDTAFTVVITDELSAYLDINTFERGNSSHDYRLDISGERMLTYTFNNILLPDSTTNLEGSNGFVDFSISPLLDAPLEMLIENEAAIYFDFNEPVITNTVFHTLGRDFYEIVDWVDLSSTPLSLHVYPNPASNTIQLGLENSPIDQQVVRVLDMSGQLMYQSTFTTSKMLINIEQWPANSYLIQLLDNNGMLLGTGHLVKQGR